MINPRRLFDDSKGLERGLLRAGRADAPPKGAQSRAGVALGLGAGAAIAATTSAATATASVPKVTTAGGALLLKILGASLVTGAVAVAAVEASDRPTDVPMAALSGVTATAKSPTPPARSPTVRAEPESVPSALPEPEPAQARSIPIRMRPAAPRGAPLEAADTGRAARRAGGSTLGDELALLDLARAALGRGESATTLRLLDEYDADFPSGALTLESSVLRIDSLEKLGMHDAALRSGQRFLAEHPDEPLSKHVRSLVDRLQAATNP